MNYMDKLKESEQKLSMISKKVRDLSIDRKRAKESLNSKMKFSNDDYTRKYKYATDTSNPIHSPTQISNISYTGSNQYDTDRIIERYKLLLQETMNSYEKSMIEVKKMVFEREDTSVEENFSPCQYCSKNMDINSQINSIKSVHEENELMNKKIEEKIKEYDVSLINMRKEMNIKDAEIEKYKKEIEKSNIKLRDYILHYQLSLESILDIKRFINLNQVKYEKNLKDLNISNENLGKKTIKMKELIESYTNLVEGYCLNNSSSSKHAAKLTLETVKKLIDKIMISEETKENKDLDYKKVLMEETKNQNSNLIINTAGNSNTKKAVKYNNFFKHN